METTEPHSRRFRFGLRAMFVALTVAALIAWHLQKSPLYVIGNLPPADIAAIRHAVETTNQLHEKRLLSIRVISPTEVEVETGEIRGPLDGGGQTATLTKTNGVWKITGVGYWVS